MKRTRLRKSWPFLLAFTGLAPWLACGARADDLELLLSRSSSALEARLVRDQVELYLDELPLPLPPYASQLRRQLRLAVRHRRGRVFDYELELLENGLSLGLQRGTRRFEEFRQGFGRSFEAVLTRPATVQLLSLDAFGVEGLDPREARRKLIGCLEATEHFIVLENADFAHHRLAVQLDGHDARIAVDGTDLETTSLEEQGLWAPALAIASHLRGETLRRVRLALLEYGEGQEYPRALLRGSLAYRLGQDGPIRQIQNDGEGYPLLVAEGTRITLFRSGYYPRSIRIRRRSPALQPVYLVARTVPVRFRVLVPGHRLGPLRLLGYDGERLLAEDGDTLSLKRDYKYRYAMDVVQRGQRHLEAGWFIVPEDGPFELYDEQFPNNLALQILLGREK